MELVRKRSQDNSASARRHKRRKDGSGAPSTSVPRSDKFATFLLKDPGVRHHLSSYLGPKDWFCLSQTSKALQETLQNERWDLNKRLRRWVSDPTEFRRQMGRSGALLAGDVAYEFFTGVSMRRGVGTIQLIASGAEDILDYLKTKENYTEPEPSKANWWRLARTSSDYGVVMIGLLKVDFPFLAILRSDRNATGYLNFISCNKAYSMFPYATFVKHKMYALQPLDTSFTGFLQDYERHGWDTEDVVRPISINGKCQAPALPASMRTPRIVGDKHTWTMELDYINMSSSCPTSTLERCEFRVSTHLKAQFFEIEEEILQHPLLAHQYTFVRLDWKQAVLTRLNDMLVMELAKLEPEDKRRKKYINKPLNTPYSVRGLDLTSAGRNFAALERRSHIAESEGLAKKDHMMRGWQKQLLEKRPHYDESDTRFFYLE